MGVTHVAFNFGAGYQCCNGVDDHDINGAGTNQHVHDFQRLLAGVGLRDQQLVDVHAQLCRVDRVQRVLGVDERCHAACLLNVRYSVQCNGGLTGGLGTVNLDDAAAGQTANTQSGIQGDSAGGDDLGLGDFLITQAHDCTLAVVLVDLCHHGFKCLGATLFGNASYALRLGVLSHGSTSFFVLSVVDGSNVSSESVGLVIETLKVLAYRFLLRLL